jgi:hypothetical protein
MSGKSASHSYEGPKNGKKFAQYDFKDVDSVAAFWLEQLRITLASLHSIKNAARFG